MPIHKLPLTRHRHTYFFEPFTGLLLARPVTEAPLAHHGTPPRVCAALALNDEPYQLRPIATPEQPHARIPWWLGSYARLLVRICRLSFGLAQLMARLRLPVYTDATEAILAFRKVFPGEAQQELCLPRSLFAAATSRKFRDHGVVFIGVFLPSRSMHAWVIEDGIQPDPFDGGWINFRPVAALTL